jgi:hypothetical protein
MNDTTENFWQVFNNLEPYQAPVVLRRLYYDDSGFPLFYTQEDKPGNYIDITPEQYQRASMRVRVRNGQLIELKTSPVKKLVPAETGTPCHPHDVSIVVGLAEEHTKWSKRVFESN